MYSQGGYVRIPWLLHIRDVLRHSDPLRSRSVQIIPTLLPSQWIEQVYQYLETRYQLSSAPTLGRYRPHVEGSSSRESSYHMVIDPECCTWLCHDRTLQVLVSILEQIMCHKVFDLLIQCSKKTFPIILAGCVDKMQKSLNLRYIAAQKTGELSCSNGSHLLYLREVVRHGFKKFIGSGVTNMETVSALHSGVSMGLEGIHPGWCRTSYIRWQVYSFYDILFLVCLLYLSLFHWIE